MALNSPIQRPDDELNKFGPTPIEGHTSHEKELDLFELMDNIVMQNLGHVVDEVTKELTALMMAAGHTGKNNQVMFDKIDDLLHQLSNVLEDAKAHYPEIGGHINCYLSGVKSGLDKAAHFDQGETREILSSKSRKRQMLSTTQAKVGVSAPKPDLGGTQPLGASSPFDNSSWYQKQQSMLGPSNDNQTDPNAPGANPPSPSPHSPAGNNTLIAKRTPNMSLFNYITEILNCIIQAIKEYHNGNIGSVQLENIVGDNYQLASNAIQGTSGPQNQASSGAAQGGMSAMQQMMQQMMGGAGGGMGGLAGLMGGAGGAGGGMGGLAGLMGGAGGGMGGGMLGAGAPSGGLGGMLGATEPQALSPKGNPVHPMATLMTELAPKKSQKQLSKLGAAPPPATNPPLFSKQTIDIPSGASHGNTPYSNNHYEVENGYSPTQSYDLSFTISPNSVLKALLALVTANKDAFSFNMVNSQNQTTTVFITASELQAAINNGGTIDLPLGNIPQSFDFSFYIYTKGSSLTPLTLTISNPTLTTTQPPPPSNDAQQAYNTFANNKNCTDPDGETLEQYFQSETTELLTLYNDYEAAVAIYKANPTMANYENIVTAKNNFSTAYNNLTDQKTGFSEEIAYLIGKYPNDPNVQKFGTQFDAIFNTNLNKFVQTSGMQLPLNPPAPPNPGPADQPPGPNETTEEMAQAVYNEPWAQELLSILQGKYPNPIPTAMQQFATDVKALMALKSQFTALSNPNTQAALALFKKILALQQTVTGEFYTAIVNNVINSKDPSMQAIQSAYTNDKGSDFQSLIINIGLKMCDDHNIPIKDLSAGPMPMAGPNCLTPGNPFSVNSSGDLNAALQWYKGAYNMTDPTSPLYYKKYFKSITGPYGTKGIELTSHVPGTPTNNESSKIGQGALSYQLPTDNVKKGDVIVITAYVRYPTTYTDPTNGNQIYNSGSIGIQGGSANDMMNGTKEITGQYATDGHHYTGWQPVRFVVQAGKDNPDLQLAMMTGSNGTMDLAGLRAENLGNISDPTTAKSVASEYGLDPNPPVTNPPTNPPYLGLAWEFANMASPIPGYDMIGLGNFPERKTPYDVPTAGQYGGNFLDGNFSQNYDNGDTSYPYYQMSNSSVTVGQNGGHNIRMNPTSTEGASMTATSFGPLYPADYRLQFTVQVPPDATNWNPQIDVTTQDGTMGDPPNKLQVVQESLKALLGTPLTPGPHQVSIDVPLNAPLMANGLPYPNFQDYTIPSINISQTAGQPQTTIWGMSLEAKGTGNTATDPYAQFNAHMPYALDDSPLQSELLNMYKNIQGPAKSIIQNYINHPSNDNLQDLLKEFQNGDIPHIGGPPNSVYGSGWSPCRAGNDIGNYDLNPVPNSDGSVSLRNYYSDGQYHSSGIQSSSFLTQGPTMMSTSITYNGPGVGDTYQPGGYAPVIALWSDAEHTTDSRDPNSMYGPGSAYADSGENDAEFYRNIDNGDTMLRVACYDGLAHGGGKPHTFKLIDVTKETGGAINLYDGKPNKIQLIDVPRGYGNQSSFSVVVNGIQVGQYSAPSSTHNLNSGDVAKNWRISLENASWAQSSWVPHGDDESPEVNVTAPEVSMFDTTNTAEQRLRQDAQESSFAYNTGGNGMAFWPPPVGSQNSYLEQIQNIHQTLEQMILQGGPLQNYAFTLLQELGSLTTNPQLEGAPSVVLQDIQADFVNDLSKGNIFFTYPLATNAQIEALGEALGFQSGFMDTYADQSPGLNFYRELTQNLYHPSAGWDDNVQRLLGAVQGMMQSKMVPHNFNYYSDGGKQMSYLLQGFIDGKPPVPGMTGSLTSSEFQAIDKFYKQYFPNGPALSPPAPPPPSQGKFYQDVVNDYNAAPAGPDKTLYQAFMEMIKYYPYVMQDKTTFQNWINALANGGKVYFPNSYKTPGDPQSVTFSSPPSATAWATLEKQMQTDGTVPAGIVWPGASPNPPSGGGGIVGTLTSDMNAPGVTPADKALYQTFIDLFTYYKWIWSDPTTLQQTLNQMESAGTVYFKNAYKTRSAPKSVNIPGDPSPVAWAQIKSQLAAAGITIPPGINWPS